MKVTFIRPNIFDDRLASAMEVLAFAILKALTPPDVETVLYDERLEPIPYSEDTDLVAMTVETFTARRAYQIADRYRCRGIKVVMGGFHPSMVPDEAALFADAVVIGDAESVWGEIISDARRQTLKPVYRGDDQRGLDGVRFDRSIFAGKRYAPMSLVQWSRGCRFNCSFCSIRAFYGSSVRRRPIPEIVAEIERLGRRPILFVDDNLFVDVENAKALMRALIPLRIKWCCQVSIDVACEPDLLDLMRRSGCVTALIGFESLEPESLTLMKKRWNLKWIDYATAISRFRDAGIMLWGAFVLGWDQDSPDIFDRTVEFAIRHKLAVAGFNILMPTPGTRLYEELRSEGRLIYDRWWVDPRYRYGEAVFVPRNMTADQFTEGCFRALKEFSSWRSILHRAMDPSTVLRSPMHMLIYSLVNVRLRSEVHRKQFAPFGAQDDMDPFERIQAKRLHLGMVSA
ncbi:radical SAM protein [Roseomonas sp. HF4]|uniref:B12-binding domain-containing radical SAM protein n=1 Tax=Roseomonas sp. HF4 TaxID=2562313 RepID=UPI0010C048C7|nr:radical SAM protein [Roseomonas sp. HF4]